jgi:hypothetical protein
MKLFVSPLAISKLRRLHLTDAGKSPANAKSTKESGKTGLQLAEEDAEQGRVTCWPSDDEMFHTILRK